MCVIVATATAAVASVAVLVDWYIFGIHIDFT